MQRVYTPADVSEKADAGDSARDMGLASGVTASIQLLAIIAVCLTLYFARGFFLPVVLAVIIALTLSPVVRQAQRYRVPSVVTAGFMVMFLTGAIVAGVATLAAPFAELVSDAPRIGSELKSKLRSLKAPVEAVNRASEEVENIATTGEEEATQEVVIKQPGLIARAADDLAAMIASALLTLVLCFFLLISRDMFFGKVVRVLPKLADKKRALTVAKEVERDVSRYLLTITAINSGLGCTVGVAFWALGMPNPLLWGVLAGALNFLPYVGSLIGVVASMGVAIVTFDSLGSALPVPVVYAAITMLEGQMLTPLILGRRFSLNTVIILVSLAFWAFLWGPVGVFISVPVLIILKVFCERVTGLETLGEFISGEQTNDTDT